MKIRIDKGCLYVDSQKIEWGEEREKVRSTIKLPFVVDDAEYDFVDPPIILKRDVFGSLEKGPAYIFCNYDELEKLKELELHKAEDLNIAGQNINFGDPVINVYLSTSPNKAIFRDGEGTLVLPDQKITMASSEKMGSYRDGLGYIYFGASLEHLGKIVEVK